MVNIIVRIYEKINVYYIIKKKKFLIAFTLLLLGSSKIKTFERMITLIIHVLKLHGEQSFVYIILF